MTLHDAGSRQMNFRKIRRDRHMQNHPPSSDCTHAMESYLKKLRTLRSLNTLAVQNVVASEHVERIKHDIIKKWDRDQAWYIAQTTMQQIRDLLDEISKDYDAVLKKLRETPIVMTTGAELTEADIMELKRRQELFDAIQTEREKALEKLDHLITLLRGIAADLQEKINQLQANITAMEKQRNELDVRCLEAALILYTVPDDQDEATEVDLSTVAALQPYLLHPPEGGKPILRLNHTHIVKNYQRNLQSNSQGIDENRIETCYQEAVEEEVKTELHTLSEHGVISIPSDNYDSVFAYFMNREQIKVASAKIKNSTQSSQHNETLATIHAVSADRAQLENNLSDTRAEQQAEQEELKLTNEKIKFHESEAKRIEALNTTPLQKAAFNVQKKAAIRSTTEPQKNTPETTPETILPTADTAKLAAVDTAPTKETPHPQEAKLPESMANPQKDPVIRPTVAGIEKQANSSEQKSPEAPPSITEKNRASLDVTTTVKNIMSVLGDKKIEQRTKRAKKRIIADEDNSPSEDMPKEAKNNQPDVAKNDSKFGAPATPEETSKMPQKSENTRGEKQELEKNKSQDSEQHSSRRLGGP